MDIRTIVRRLPRRKVMQSLLITIAIAATIHICIVGIMSLVKRSISYINPLDFLGISYVIPEYRESRTAALIGWLVLLSLFGGVLYVSIHYHLYLSVIRDSRMHQKFKAVSKTIKSNIKN